MKYFITGNLGYIGPVLCDFIKRNDKDAFIIGYDTGYFLNCAISPKLPKYKPILDLQVYGDVRDKNKIDCYLDGVDHVIHLAAISNDPMGKDFEKATIDINQFSSLYLARKCIELKINSFTFASSCSVYGAGSDKPRTELDLTNPLTAYARSKIGTEEGLQNLRNFGDTKITCLRFSTACGYSPNFRLDLVLNDFVATALTTNSIKILSDGTPWRPLIDVEDMARALYWSCLRDKGELLEIINIGSSEWNYQIKELAESTKKELGGKIKIDINKNATTDKRSYKVSFEKYYSLAPSNFTPKISLSESIKKIYNGLKNFSEEISSDRSYLIRLNVLRSLKASNKLDNNLFWVESK